VIRKLGLLLLALGAAGSAQEKEVGPFDVIDALLRADGGSLASLPIKDSLLRSKEGSTQFFPDDEPHLLPAVRDSLDKPWEIAARGEQIAGKVHAAGGLGPALQELQAYHRPALLAGGWSKPEPLEGLESLDREVADAVSAIHAAIKLAQRYVDAAFAQLAEEEIALLRKTLPRWVTRTEQADKEKLLAGEEDVAEREALVQCAALWQRVDEKQLRMGWTALVTVVTSNLDPLRKQAAFRETKAMDTAIGKVILRGHSNDGGNADADLVIDFGGDDEFNLPKELKPRRVRVVIDVSGDDLYLSDKPHWWGAALLGLSLHVDLAGNDDYRAPDWSLGCALGGHAALWDRVGKDRYYGGLGSQGVGIFGTGVLKDDDGDDEYAAACFAQGFGSTAGLGAIVDSGGDDTYLAGRDEPDMWRRKGTYITFAQGSGLGHRMGHVVNDETGGRRWKITGQTPGGVGLLFDAGGNDRYEADVFGQGSSYWYSLGLLVDGGGNDRYRATWYGQGVGTHAAVGCVVDAGGDDWYYSRNTSQGCGHDFSAGILVDRGGDDTYRGVTLCQGAGNAYCGLGVLIDEAGDDTYHCGRRAWGFGSTEKRADAAPYGFFLDLGGANKYEGEALRDVKPEGRWRQGARGFGVDGR